MPDAVVPDPALDALDPAVRRRVLRAAARHQAGGPLRLWWQRRVMSRLVLAAAGPVVVDGLVHVERLDHDRPILLLANHRSYLDFFVVAAYLLARTPWACEIGFPVRAEYCYGSWRGEWLNRATGWSVFPPFFRLPGTAAVDRWSLERLIDACRAGPGRVIGFHPEGTRHLEGTPWDLLPAQPGAGRLVHEARPQTLPVFIGGLANDWRSHRALRARGLPVRIRFGAPWDHAPYADLPSRARTWVAIGAGVMARIAELAAEDRAAWPGAAAAAAKA